MQAIKAYWGVEIQLQSFLTLALGGGEWSGLALGTSLPMKTTSPPTEQGTAWMGDRATGRLGEFWSVCECSGAEKKDLLCQYVSRNLLWHISDPHCFLPCRSDYLTYQKHRTHNSYVFLLEIKEQSLLSQVSRFFFIMLTRPGIWITTQAVTSFKDFVVIRVSCYKSELQGQALETRKKSDNDQGNAYCTARNWKVGYIPQEYAFGWSGVTE